ncbi:MAG: isoaspartyl peptidase/L-asparaginase, partial [Candidatus Thorarchaeota archaeon]
SCGKLNAGIGAAKNSDGIRELDAIIVDGSSLDFGSVAAVVGIHNPISLARYIMEKTEHKFFAGTNALRVYAKMLADGYRQEKSPGLLEVDVEAFVPDTTDTVGCVVVDSQGRIAATSSTGGIRKKMPGRVGDSPVMGAGAYANDVCGVAATGYGEHIIRVLLSRMISLYVEQGEEVQKAAERGIRLLIEKTGSEAGVIAADVNGNVGAATNAKAMPTAVIRGNMDTLQVMAMRKEIEKFFQ